MRYMGLSPIRRFAGEIWLVLRHGAVEFRQRPAAFVDLGEQRIIRKVQLDPGAARVIELRYEVDVAERRFFVVAKGRCGRAPAQQFFQRCEAVVEPMAIPGKRILLGGIEGRTKMSLNFRADDRVDLAGDDLAESAGPRPRDRVGWQQRGSLETLFDEFDQGG